VRTPSSSVAVFNLDSRKNYSSTETFAPKLSSNYLDGLRIERGHFVYSPIPTYEILLKSVNLSSRSKISNGSKRYPSKKIGVSFFLRGGDTKNRSSRHSGQTDYTSVLKELEPIHILSPPPKKKRKHPSVLPAAWPYMETSKSFKVSQFFLSMCHHNVVIRLNRLVGNVKGARFNPYFPKRKQSLSGFRVVHGMLKTSNKAKIRHCDRPPNGMGQKVTASTNQLQGPVL